MENDPFATWNTTTSPKAEDGKAADAETDREQVVSGNESKSASGEKAPAKKSVPRGQTVAQDGRILSSLPPQNDFPMWEENHSPENTFLPDEQFDFTDLSDLNLEINRARARSFRIKNALANARRDETRAAEDYRRAYNRALVSLSGGNAEHRKAMAEIQCEDLYTDKLITEGIVKELVNLSYTVGRDLDTLKTISDNLRKQLSM